MYDSIFILIFQLERIAKLLHSCGFIIFALMENSKPYREFGDFLREVFPYKVQKISINAGFTCPNRDGTKGFGVVPTATIRRSARNIAIQKKSVTEQLEAGVRFFSRKYPEMKYLPISKPIQTRMTNWIR